MSFDVLNFYKMDLINGEVSRWLKFIHTFQLKRFNYHLSNYINSQSPYIEVILKYLIQQFRI